MTSCAMTPLLQTIFEGINVGTFFSSSRVIYFHLNFKNAS